EMRWAVTHHDFGRAANSGHSLLLERRGIDFAVRHRGEMNLHVVDCCRQVLDSREPLIKVLCLFDLGDEVRRDRLACTEMKREPIEKFRCRQPVLAKLARELHEITFYGSAGKSWIADV